MASIFRVEEISSAKTSRWQAEYFFDPENGGDTHLRNVG
jgi:hypothetical protein